MALHDIESEPLIYHVDSLDRIVWVNHAWNDFALANGGILLATDVVGQGVFQFITGEPARMYLSVILESVRTLKRSCLRPYRCDSPGTKRFMEMEVGWESPNLVRLEHRCVREEQCVPNVEFLYKPGPDSMRRCSICNRVEAQGRWHEASQLVHDNTTSTLEVSYHVCEDCRQHTRGRKPKF